MPAPSVASNPSRSFTSRWLPFLALGLLLCVLAPTVPAASMDDVAERWVKVALSMNEHDDGYVDAYQGPEAWKEEAVGRAWTLEQIATEAGALLEMMAAVPTEDVDEVERLRHSNLTKLLSSLQARVRMVQGEKLTFDEESLALYDAVAPHHEPAHYQRILNQLDALLPGDGSTGERLNAFRELFVIPPDRLDAVFQAAIQECRKRSLPRFDLPENEGFTVEYVEGKSWSAYNWFQGDSQSLIQVNTDLPIYIDRAIDLACHEGYPGHHVYNLLIEQELYKKRGWMEFSILVLFGPQALIAEGSANYGIDMTFPGKERIAYEKRVLFPMAGLDAELAERYYKILALLDKLEFSGNEAARDYLDGKIDADAAVDYMMKYRLMTRGRAERFLRFVDTYRSYVISYNLGRKMVGEWIESTDGRASSTEERWERFTKLLSQPYLPSDLQ